MLCSEEKMHLLEDCCVRFRVWFWSAAERFWAWCWQGQWLSCPFIYMGYVDFVCWFYAVFMWIFNWSFIAKAGFL